MHCVHCGTAIPEGGRFCQGCGSACPQTADADPAALTLTRAGSDAGWSSDTSGQPRFIPGAVIDGRYRVVGLLGRGGMGEVYRADDLKLGQPVALKFLPIGLDRDPRRLQQFLDEVRTARKVTHPNVCRVYDIGEVDGQHFLSMEYVDGEDLASLLRRIGRLPRERAVEVARQICAALAATHEQGILHRDLKPANVMIDGRGQVRLTDFGLASLAAGDGDTKRGAGTPAYMAPEQLSGGEASVSSDVYALGLVLYELFTGKAVFAADTVAELRHMHESTAPSHPSSHIDDLDPAVEAVVLRCLEKLPTSRPATVHAVALALPGGDPFAAALAAGQTPSPELVAEAGARPAMRPAKAMLLALAGLAIVFGGARWAATMTNLHFLPLEKRPEVLIDRAQSVLVTLGFDAPVYTEPVDTAWGFLQWSGVFNEVAESSSARGRWEALRERPDAGGFWYRQSPTILLPTPTLAGPVLARPPPGVVDPPASTPGEVTIVLDLRGRLTRLEVMPKRFSTVEVGEPDWGPMFELAELDRTRFTEARPGYQRFMSPDHRRAWTGTRSEHPGIELRVEAGSFEGRPVLFNVAPASTMDSLGNDPVPRTRSLASILVNASQPVVILIVVAFSVALTRRNVRQGRMDSRGAMRFAVLTFAINLVTGTLSSHVIFTAFWPRAIWPLIVGATFFGIMGYGLYSAAEPLGRQVWPTMFVSSSRLLSRPRIEWRDPLIGESILYGLIAGGVAYLVWTPLQGMLQILTEGSLRFPFGYDFNLLRGLRPTLASILRIELELGMAAVMIVALIVLRRAVKNRWLAMGLATLVWASMYGVGSLESLLSATIASALYMFVLLRWGVVAFVTTCIVVHLAGFARASDWSAWWAEPTRWALAVTVGLAVYGVWAATGGIRKNVEAERH